MPETATYRKGVWSEWATAVLLTAKGYRVRARRYKTRYGEIDLIATKGKTVAFIEVKARDAERDGLEAIRPHHRARIQDAAAHFMQRNPALSDYVWRFDAAVVRPYRLPYHLKDAWRP